jgi:hypothetical protein
LGHHVAATPPGVDGEPARQGNKWVIRIGIVATVLVSLLAVSVLYRTWYRTETRDALIIVWGPDDKSWDGARVVVTGPGLTGALSTELTAEDHMLARFHVPPGHYLVRVTRPDGKVLAERATHPDRPMLSKMFWWPFRAPAAATQMGFQ